MEGREQQLLVDQNQNLLQVFNTCPEDQLSPTFCCRSRGSQKPCGSDGMTGFVPVSVLVLPLFVAGVVAARG